MKSLVKSGLTKIVAIVMASLICSKSLFPLSSHSKQASPFNKLFKGLTISTKFGMNLLMKLILPKNDCKDFLSLGRGIFLFASILEGSTEIPSLEMICPNNFPLYTPKIDFLGLRETPYSLHLSNITHRC
jgi:hypothetical protein